LDNSAGDILGTPLRSSLKWVLPSSSSRTTSSVHRSSSTSIALATGQNWPYVVIPGSFPLGQVNDEQRPRRQYRS